MNKFTHPNVKFTLDDKDLYDDVCFSFAEQKDANAYSSRYSLKSIDIPVHGYFGLHIKPDKPIPFALRDKIALIYSDGKDENGKATTNDNGWYKANVRAFGEYRLVADTSAPVITPTQGKETLTKASRIVFRIKEATTSVDKCMGKIDGKWVPFEQAGDLFFYTFDEHCPPGNHELVLTATDENNNTQTLTYKFKR